jgi:FtsP/CotA-like multicopper oxidase with cupredoxin domain
MKTRNSGESGGARKAVWHALLGIASLATLQAAQAGPGIAPVQTNSGAPAWETTYMANSPSGPRPDPTNMTGPMIDSGTALRKFVDGLPLIPGLAPTTKSCGTATGPAAALCATNGMNALGQTLTIMLPPGLMGGVGKTWPTDGAHYYHIAVVEYAEQMHSDLPNIAHSTASNGLGGGTVLRGYVQIEEPGECPTAAKCTSPADSEHIPLHYPNGTSITLPDAGGTQQQVYAYHKPHYLGATIVAVKDVPIRIKYSNLLPLGAATATDRMGDLFVPVDPSIPGGAMQQNRVAIHLHGGLTPWISDGTPHQWTIPVGETRYGYLTDLAVTNGGTGYTSVPTVVIAPPSSGATAAATVANGAVTGLNVLKPGANYTTSFLTTAGNVIIAAPPTFLAAATGATLPLPAPVNGTIAAGAYVPTGFVSGNFGYFSAAAANPIPATAPKAQAAAAAAPLTLPAPVNGVIATGAIAPAGFTAANFGYFAPIAPIAATAPPAAVRATLNAVTPVGGVIALGTIITSSNAATNYGYFSTGQAAVTFPAPTGAFPRVRAQGVATIANGRVVSVTVTTAGTGYTNSPKTATIAIPPASVTAQVALTQVNGVITALSVSTAGIGYTTAPTFALPQPATSVTAAVTPTIASGTITGFAVTTAGVNYTAAPAFNLPALSTRAAATLTGASVGTNGAVTGLTVSGGLGYATAPAVTIALPPGSAQATATATVTNGVVTGLAINPNGAGAGYTASPAVTFTGGNGTGATATSLILPPVGDSFQNVPDMIGDLPPTMKPAFYTPPALGEGTLYYTNNQSSRLMMYHDHASGITRLNAYVTEAAGYLLVDPLVDPVVAGLTPAGSLDGFVPREQIPLVIQDKGFVPKDVSLQDARWDTVHWGQYGDLYYPHVYETNQNPSLLRGINPLGRWDWGPWFWPSFPSQFSLPTGAYGDVTLTPEAWMDTATVNGTAYPTLTVEPRAYRFRILVVGNDRMFNLGFYVADSSQKADATVPTPNGPPAANTEVAQISARGVPTAAMTAATCKVNCATWPASWPTDGHIVPDPSSAGPPFIVIGNEGGLLPQWVQTDPIPVSYDYNRRSVTVLNVSQNNDITQPCFPECHGLYMGPAERADAIVDFAPYAGQTLILYNDAPAPNPGYDTRLDYYTGNDPTQNVNYLTGGAPNTLAGFGPSTRTIMQVKVLAAATTALDYNKALMPDNKTYNPLALGAGITYTAGTFDATKNTVTVSGSINNVGNGLNGPLQLAYAATQDAPIVPEAAYNAVGAASLAAAAKFGTNSVDNHANIYTGTPTEPYLLVSGSSATPTTVSDVVLTGGGTGYTATPTVTITPPGCAINTTTCVQATAAASISAGKVVSLTLTSNGAGYTAAPYVTISAGAGVGTPTLTNGGSGYTAAPLVSFSGGGGTGAAATATITGDKVTALALISGGSGYTSAPAVTIAAPTMTNATATTAPVAGTSVTLATYPVIGGGAGYTAAQAATAVTIAAPSNLSAGTPAVVMSGTGTNQSVGSLTLNGGGAGYLVAPTVTLSAPPVPTAPTMPVFAPTGGAISTGLVVPTSGGSNYASAPTATFSAPPAPTAPVLPAVIAATGGTFAANTPVTAATNGSNYGSAPAVTVLAPLTSPASATAVLTNGIAGLGTLVGGSGYNNGAAPVVTVLDTPAAGVTAIITATTIGTPPGPCCNYVIANGGSGYPASFTLTVNDTPPGVGTGATATANVTNGVVTSITLTAIGTTLYTTPVVVVQPAPAAGTAPTVTATIDANTGAVNGLSFAGQVGFYQAAPRLSIAAPAAPTAASANATYNVTTGQVTGITIGGGAGYSSLTPAVIQITGGAGTAATVSAVTIANGAVTGVSVASGGTGYYSPPTLNFAGGQGLTATAQATLSGGSAVTGYTLVAPNFGGSGYSAAPTVTLTGGGGGTQATATATISNGVITSYTVTSGGSAYTSAPAVTFAAPAGTQATATTSIGAGGMGATAVAQLTGSAGVFSVPCTAVSIQPCPGLPTGSSAKLLGKLNNYAIQELFEPFYGRMNATLGVELPHTTALTQTTIPLAYVDPPTELVAAGETQIWKITHNGVDAHPVHFHLVNIQVLNRVGWDGSIKPPEDSEQGWKETLKMNPLEDVIVAVQAKMPKVPFGLAKSMRADDPSQPLGVVSGFTQVDTALFQAGASTVGNAAAAPIVNTVEVFDNEYVWHCHILGHEENDFMRAFNAYTVTTAPAAPTPLHLNGATSLNTMPTAPVVLTWADPTPIGTAAAQPTTYGNAANELGFEVRRAEVLSYSNGVPNPGPWMTIATTPANVTTAVDPLTTPLTPFTDYVYDVHGFNEKDAEQYCAGSTAPCPTGPGLLQQGALPSAVVRQDGGSAQALVKLALQPVSPLNCPRTGLYDSLTWVNPNAVAFDHIALTRTGGGAPAAFSLPYTATSYLDIGPAATGLSPTTDYAYTVTLYALPTSTTGPQTTCNSLAPARAVTNLAAQMVSANVIRLNFTNLSTGETGYTVQMATNGGGTNWAAIPGTIGQVWSTTTPAANGAVTLTLTWPAAGVPNNSTLSFRVAPTYVSGALPQVTGPWSNVPPIILLDTQPANPAGLGTALGAAGSGRITLTWNAQNNVATYRLQWRSATTAGGIAGATFADVVPLGTIPGNATTWTVTGVPGLYYQFRLRADNVNGNSGNVLTPAGTGSVQAP